MLRGAAEVSLLAEGAVALAGFGTEPLKLPGVETLQVFCEIESEGSGSLLPPGLHPTLPPAVTWLVQRVAGSPWGAFQMAQCRIECRSGLRPRGFLRGGVIDSAEAARALGARWGYTLRLGEVRLQRRYDRVRATALLGGEAVLDLELRDPTPLQGADIHYVANVNLADTPRGVRPSYPVSASFGSGNVTLPALRYVCRPEGLAFEGSERVDG